MERSLHFPWSRRIYGFTGGPYLVRLAENEEYRTVDQVWPAASASDASDEPQRFPTVAELDGELPEGTDPTGTIQTRDVDLSADWEKSGVENAAFLSS